MTDKLNDLTSQIKGLKKAAANNNRAKSRLSKADEEINKSKGNNGAMIMDVNNGVQPSSGNGTDQQKGQQEPYVRSNSSQRIANAQQQPRQGGANHHQSRGQSSHKQQRQRLSSSDRNKASYQGNSQNHNGQYLHESSNELSQQNSATQQQQMMSSSGGIQRPASRTGGSGAMNGNNSRTKRSISKQNLPATNTNKKLINQIIAQTQSNSNYNDNRQTPQGNRSGNNSRQGGHHPSVSQSQQFSQKRWASTDPRYDQNRHSQQFIHNGQGGALVQPSPHNQMGNNNRNNAAMRHSQNMKRAVKEGSIYNQKVKGNNSGMGGTQTTQGNKELYQVYLNYMPSDDANNKNASNSNNVMKNRQLRDQQQQLHQQNQNSMAAMQSSNNSHHHLNTNSIQQQQQNSGKDSRQLPLLPGQSPPGKVIKQNAPVNEVLLQQAFQQQQNTGNSQQQQRSTPIIQKNYSGSNQSAIRAVNSSQQVAIAASSSTATNNNGTTTGNNNGASINSKKVINQIQTGNNSGNNNGASGMLSKTQANVQLPLSTTSYQTANYKANAIQYLQGDIGIVAARQSSQPHHGKFNTSSSLDQYSGGHHQLHQTANLQQARNNSSINQSALMRNLNYSILTNELEQENSLEDMHMFFVAFHKRQKRIIEQAEKQVDKAEGGDAAHIKDQAKENSVLSPEANNNSIVNGGGSATPINNVDQLSEEIDLEE